MTERLLGICEAHEIWVISHGLNPEKANGHPRAHVRMRMGDRATEPRSFSNTHSSVRRCQLPGPSFARPTTHPLFLCRPVSLHFEQSSQHLPPYVAMFGRKAQGLLTRSSASQAAAASSAAFHLNPCLLSCHSYPQEFCSHISFLC